MHTHQFFTWITHSKEYTTLLGQHTLQRTQLYKTTRSSTHMCNIVTEFYLYSIVYIYLINSRLDVTYSVCHHFSYCKLYHGVRLVVKSREEFTVIKLTDTQHFKRLFERTLNIQTSSETIHYDHSILEM